MSKYVFIKTADNNAYMNTAANFRGAVHSGDTSVDLYFQAAAAVAGGGAFDKIALVVTSNKEEEVMTSIGAALTGTHAKGMIVIADDIAKSYVNANIGSVGNIDLAVTATTQLENVITTTVDYGLTAAESGSTVLVNHAAREITLPTCAAGLKYKIVLGVDTTAGAKIIAGADDCFFGTVAVTTTTAFSASDSNTAMQAEVLATISKDELAFTHDSATLGGKGGDIIYITGVNDVSWHVEAHLATDHADPASIAVIV